jgi:phosphatidylserine decarboxylase precursor
MDYYQKYLKYKKKYNNLKNQQGGFIFNKKASIVDLSGNSVKQPGNYFLHKSIHLQKLGKIGNYIGDKMTDFCKNYNDERTAYADIKKFKDSYKIDKETIEICKDATDDECIRKFTTSNNFFIRKRTNLPSTSTDSCIALVSPTDCYCIYIDDKSLKEKLWIKGSMFSLENLIDNKTINSNDYHVFIFRLAPHHYHRYHSPLNGKLLSITKLGTLKLSVDPILVNSTRNVYTNNVRLVLKVQLNNDTESIAYIVVIGATCVASIVLTHSGIIKAYNNIKKTDITEYKDNLENSFDFSSENVVLTKNEELGNFQYGGSTLLVLYPKKNTTFTDIGNFIKNKSSESIETEIIVGNDILENY